MSMEDIGSYRSFYNELRNELFISVSISFEEVLENIKNPVWGDVWDGRCWKNYILPPTRKRWTNLSMETKLVLVILAEKQANDED